MSLVYLPRELHLRATIDIQADRIGSSYLSASRRDPEPACHDDRLAVTEYRTGLLRLSVDRFGSKFSAKQLALPSVTNVREIFLLEACSEETLTILGS